MTLVAVQYQFLLVLYFKQVLHLHILYLSLEYEIAASVSDSNLPNVICVITGKFD